MLLGALTLLPLIFCVIGIILISKDDGEEGD